MEDYSKEAVSKITQENIDAAVTILARKAVDELNERTLTYTQTSILLPGTVYVVDSGSMKTIKVNKPIMQAVCAYFRDKGYAASYYMGYNPEALERSTVANTIYLRLDWD